MTLRQLRCIGIIIKCGTLTAAVKTLFVTQPSLTAVLRELERELGITLSLRSRKGLSPIPAGEELLGYARQILDQVSLVEQRYTGEVCGCRHPCISSQHYSFVVEVFVVLLNAYGGSQYEFHMWEIETYRILEDVVKARSEIGVLCRNQFNAAVLQRNFQETKLSLTLICRVEPYVFLETQHPFTKKAEILMEDLRDYPCLSYEQGQHNLFYFSEEIQSAAESDKDIVVCDCATLFNLLIGTNGHTTYSGIINIELNGKNIVARPFAVDDYMEFGYALSKERPISDLTLAYIDLLRQFVR